MKSITVFLGIISIVCPPACGPQPTVEQRLRDLENRVSALEKGPPTTTTDANNVPKATERPPSDDKIKSMIETYLRDKRIGRFANRNYVQQPNKVESVAIVNRYKKNMGGEQWYVYDATADVTSPGETFHVNIRMGVVKRGELWYPKELDE